MNTEILQPTSIMALIDTTKESRQSFIQAAIADLKDGGKDPLLFHIHVKNMESMIKDLTSNKEYKNLVHEATVPYGKSFDRHNAKVEIKEAGTSYDYTNCNDPELEELFEAMNLAKEKLKERETFLKNIPSAGIDNVTKDGEVVKIYPPVKSSSTTVSITLK